MSATVLSRALRVQRDFLAARWCDRFIANGEESGACSFDLSVRLVGALLDEVILLLDLEDPSDMAECHHARVFKRAGSFAQQVATCIDAFQAGAQVIGAFVVENAGPRAAWTVSARNRFLGELDAIFHLLVHREVNALCRLQTAQLGELDRPDAGTSFIHGHSVSGLSDGALSRN